MTEKVTNDRQLLVTESSSHWAVEHVVVAERAVAVESFVAAECDAAAECVLVADALVAVDEQFVDAD